MVLDLRKQQQFDLWNHILQNFDFLGNQLKAKSTTFFISQTSFYTSQNSFDIKVLCVIYQFIHFHLFFPKVAHTKICQSHINKIESLDECMGKNLHYINSAKSSSKREITLT